MYNVKLHVFTISLFGTKYINHEIEFAVMRDLCILCYR